MTERNFAWGDTIVVRQALVDSLPNGFSFISPQQNLLGMGYPPHEGDPELIELLKDLASVQMGSRPRYLFVTNGATGALNASLSVLKGSADYGVFGDTYFPFYPGIVSSHGLIGISYDKMNDFMHSGVTRQGFVVIADSPSNPEGVVRRGEADIWDAAYASHKYGGGKWCQPLFWQVMCGSLSKTLGLNGIRLGWVATDKAHIAEALKLAVTNQYCGISQLQQELAKSILKVLDRHSFEIKAKSYIDDNREEWAKVAQKFGQQSGNTGMFQILRLAQAEERALNKAGVIWQPGDSWGRDRSWARISLGQDRALTRNAVKDVLS
jgi:aspartate/methionine/tyrosine aminotransferase